MSTQTTCVRSKLNGIVTLLSTIVLRKRLIMLDLKSHLMNQSFLLTPVLSDGSMSETADFEVY